ncbi:MAG: LysM peptidoglycan-binding domain-containing protein, partial [Pseudohongiellaceae bacterium]
MTGTKRLQRLARLVLLLALVGCGSRYQAPVDQAGETLFLNAGRRHLVNEGESLYAVAWIYDLDFAALARANNLREPYLLTPGQYLDVDLRAEGGTVARSSAPARAPAAGNVVSTATTAPAAVTTLRRTPLPGGGRPTRTELPGNESPSSAPATVPPSSSAEAARAPSAPAAAQSSSAAVPSTRVPAAAAAGTAAVGTPVAPAPSPRDPPPVPNSAPAPAANSAPA